MQFDIPWWALSSQCGGTVIGRCEGVVGVVGTKHARILAKFPEDLAGWEYQFEDLRVWTPLYRWVDLANKVMHDATDV